MSQCADRDGGVCGRVSAHGGTHDSQSMGECSQHDKTREELNQHDHRDVEVNQHDQDEGDVELSLDECEDVISQYEHNHGGIDMTKHGEEWVEPA